MQADGTLITYLTDFRTNSQILRLIIPGEEELNEPRAQIVCFVSSFNNDQEIFPGFQEFTSNPSSLISNDIQPQQPPPQTLSLIPPNPQTPVRPQFDHFLQGTPQSTSNTLEQTFGPQQPPSSFNNFVIHHRKEFVIPNDGR